MKIGCGTHQGHPVPSQGHPRVGATQEGDSSHLTRASPLCTAPVSTASTSCNAAPTASRAQWKVLCGAGVQMSPHPRTSQALPRPAQGAAGSRACRPCAHS